MRWTVQVDMVTVGGEGEALGEIQWMVTLHDFYSGEPVASVTHEEVGVAFDQAMRIAMFDMVKSNED